MTDSKSSVIWSAYAGRHWLPRLGGAIARALDARRKARWRRRANLDVAHMNMHLRKDIGLPLHDTARWHAPSVELQIWHRGNKPANPADDRAHAGYIGPFPALKKQGHLAISNSSSARP